MDKVRQEDYRVTFAILNETGKVFSETWWQPGRRPHNDFGPAKVVFDPQTGRKLSEQWMQDGLASRAEEDGPAIIFYDAATGEILEQHYCLNGKTHRMNGPAEIVRKSINEPFTYTYCRFGKEVAPPGDKSAEPRPPIP